jgi:bifunctional DNA-binding transcriptional regulator/antitoxin component of YhaV-PrlF toxin-antitoxin module
MKIKTSTVSKNRQIAIPASFGIEPGQKIKLILNTENGVLTIEKISDTINDMFGIADELNFSSNDFLKEKRAEVIKRHSKLK